MTFSIVAFDPATRSWGVAVASKCLAVLLFVQNYLHLYYGHTWTLAVEV